MGQDLSAERQSEPQQSNIYQPLRHHAGGRYVCAEECRQGNCRLSPSAARSGLSRSRLPGLYAQTMAERGFPDRRFRPLLSPERAVVNPDTWYHQTSIQRIFRAAVDFLATNDKVDPEQIGIIGIRGWGGLAINAAAADPRIKATVASTMYDMSQMSMANGYFDADDSAEARNALRKKLAVQRTEDFRNGFPKPGGGVPDELPADAPQFFKDYHAYYKTPHGYHKRSLNSNQGRNATEAIPFINFPLMSRADENQECRACHPRRKGALPLLRRRRVQEVERRQQRVADYPRGQPYGPLRQS